MSGFRIIPRSEWGARHRDGFGNRPVRDLEVWLHHSVTQAPNLVAPFDDDYAAIRVLEDIGQSRFGGGISYTFAVTPVGLVFQGHSLGRIGAHTAGHNTKGIGIVLVGNYDVNNPPQAMLDAVARLLQHLAGIGAIHPAELDGGHRDTKATGCPGKFAYAKIGAINILARGHVGGGPSTPPPASQPWRGAMGWRSLSYGMVGDDVKAWQEFLRGQGFSLATDGSFGPATLSATVAWQRRNGLSADGEVGPATQAKAKAVRDAAAPKPPARRQVKVDGEWGPDFTDALQELYGTTRDRVISGQTIYAGNRGIHTLQAGSGGSQLVRAMQADMGITQDGSIGPTFIGTLQARMGTTQDRVISSPSQAVAAMQRAYNDGTLRAKLQRR